MVHFNCGWTNESPAFIATYDRSNKRAHVITINLYHKFKVHSAEHCSHCTKKTEHQKRKRKRTVFSVDMMMMMMMNECALTWRES